MVAGYLKEFIADGEAKECQLLNHIIDEFEVFLRCGVLATSSVHGIKAAAPDAKQRPERFCWNTSFPSLPTDR